MCSQRTDTTQFKAANDKYTDNITTFHHTGMNSGLEELRECESQATAGLPRKQDTEIRQINLRTVTHTDLQTDSTRSEGIWKSRNMGWGFCSCENSQWSNSQWSNSHSSSSPECLSYSQSSMGRWTCAYTAHSMQKKLLCSNTFIILSFSSTALQSMVM